MNSPKCVRTLCKLSVILIIAGVLCSCLITLSSPLLLKHLTGMEAEPFSAAVTISLFVQDMLLLPLAVLGVLHGVTGSVGGILTAVLAPVFYILRSVGSVFLQNFTYHLASGTVVGLINMLNIYRVLPSYLSMAGFVLLCCAAAISCYIERQNTPEISQNEKISQEELTQNI